jgi:hypothetical protein
VGWVERERCNYTDRKKKREHIVERWCQEDGDESVGASGRKKEWGHREKSERKRRARGDD